jgi:hypothetical protein
MGSGREGNGYDRRTAIRRRPGMVREPTKERNARAPPRKGRYEPEEEPEKGFPKKLIAPIAVIVGILVIGAIVLVIVMNSNSTISEIFVGNIEPRDMDDSVYKNESFGETLLVPMYANSDGWSSAKGKATLEITLGADPTVLYSEEVDISEGMGSTLVPMNKFVQGNGEYTFTAKAGDAGSEPGLFKVYWVTESLSIEWTDGNKDVIPTTHSYEAGFTMRPKDKEGKDLLMAPMPYSIRGTFSKPEGGDESIKIDWPATSSYVITRDVVHTMKGAYTLDIEWTNLMCASNSPYYKVRSTTSHAVDAPPYADAGDDRTVTLTGGQVAVSFDGSGSGDDGNIVEYRWDFGDNSTAVTTTPFTSHTYTEAGEYYIGLVVVDDTGQLSSERWGGAATVVVSD